MTVSLEYSLFNSLKEMRRVAGLPAIAGGSVPPSAEWSAQHLYEVVANWSPGGGDIPDPLELGAAVFADSVAVGTGFWGQVPDVGFGIDLTNEELGDGLLTTTGSGSRLQIIAANGGAEQQGGEVSIVGGNSEGNGGGPINITAGDDHDSGDGGNIAIYSGRGHKADDQGGSGGDIEIRVAGGLFSDWEGGTVRINAGNALANDGGNVEIQAGASTSGDPGQVSIYEGAFNHGIEIQPTGIVMASGVVKVAGIPTTTDPAVTGQLFTCTAAELNALLGAGAKYVLVSKGP